MSEKENFLQTVTLTLSDGRKLVYSGRVQLNKEEEGLARIVGVVFSPPIPLPEGYHLEDLPK